MPQSAIAEDVLLFAHWLRDQAVACVPLAARTKAPDVSVLPHGWKEFQRRLPTDAELLAWFGTPVLRGLAIVLGEVSGLVAVETDATETEQWCRQHLPPSPWMTRSARGIHRYYQRDANLTLPDRLNGAEVKRDGQILVAPYSVHPTGHVYSMVQPWTSLKSDLPILGPGHLSAAAASLSTKQEPVEPLPEMVHEGGRHNTLFREGCRLRRLGFDESEIEAALVAVNKQRCDPPMDRREVASIARSCARYTPAGDTHPLTEAGDASFIAARYAERLRFNHATQGWLVLDQRSGIWLPDADGLVTRLVLDAMRERQQAALKINDSELRKKTADWAFRGESHARLSNARVLTRDTEPIADSGKGWDALAHLLGTPDGVVDLRTGVTRRADPAERITMRVAVPFVPTAHSPLWDSTLASIFPEEAERVYLQTCLGYTVTGEMNLDKWFLPHGPKGRNGKGTILGAVRAILADYAVELDAATFDARKDATPFNLAKLPGRRFAHCAEAGDSTTLHHDRIKQITGGDKLMAGDKHQRAFEFNPVCKLWFSCNTRPKVKDESAAFWLRVVVILFAQTFAGREDTSIRDALRQDSQHQRAILRWLVDGARRYYAQRGLGAMPPAFQKATAEFQLENERLAEFYDACCQCGDGLSERGSNLWDAYQGWANGAGVKYPLGSKTFYQQLAARFGEPVKGRDGKWYRGIALKDSGDVPF